MDNNNGGIKTMKNLLKKFFLKIFLLTIILVVPVAMYVFIEDNAQLTWNINSIKEMNKYAIIAEFHPEKEELVVVEKIEYRNKTNKSIDKVFCYVDDILNRNEKVCQDFSEELIIKEGGISYEGNVIESVKIKNKNVDFKIIGSKSNVLMINLDEKLKKDDKLTIEIKYKIIVSHLASVTNEKTLRYMLNKWYPIIAQYDSGWKLESTYYVSSSKRDVNYFFVEITVPKGFEVEASGRLVEKTRRKTNYCFSFQDQGAENFLVNIISTEY